MRSFVVVLALAAVAQGCAARSRLMQPAGGAVAQAPSDAAQVVFIRLGGDGGKTVVILDQDSKFVGEAEVNTHFAALLPPGEHTFVAWSEGTHALKANLAAGKTYYVQVEPHMGMWGARYHLKAIKQSLENWAKLEAWMAKTEARQPVTQEGQAYVDGRRESAQGTIAKGLEQFAGYNAEEANQRTLAAEDGV